MKKDSVDLRRYEDDLFVSGTGVIVLGAWGVFKAILMCLFEYKELFNIDTGDHSSDIAAIIFAIILLLILLVVILWMHIYVGLNAVRAAQGKPYKKGYYAGAAIMIFLLALSFWEYKDIFKDLSEIDTNIASVVVDLTTIYVLAVVMISTNRIKRIS